MMRRTCACFMLLGMLGQTTASVLACTLGGARTAHAGHAGDAGRVHAASPHSHAAPLPARAVAADPAPDPGPDEIPPWRHCNRHHRGDCPHGAAFHPCHEDEPAGRLVADPGLPAAPQEPAFRLAGGPAPQTGATPAHLGRAPAPDFPPPRAL